MIVAAAVCFVLAIVSFAGAYWASTTIPRGKEYLPECVKAAKAEVALAIAGLVLAVASLSLALACLMARIG
jgi:hypothetical protein